MAPRDIPCPTGPISSIDPKTDICNPLRYLPRNGLTGATFTLAFLISTILLISMRRYGGRWMLCLVIGGYCFAAGIGVRFGLTRNPHSKGIYIAEYLLVVLSPCAFLAANYILLGHLATHLNAGRHLLIRPARLTKFFVASDVITFLIQTVGGSILTSRQPKLLKTGDNIFLAGLALQMASYFFFTMLFLLFLYNVRKHEPETWQTSGQSWQKSWKILALALGISCIGILIRSVYRTAELSQGFLGPLSTSEGLFYGLDAYPLLIAIGVYTVFWPGHYINEDNRAESQANPRVGSAQTEDTHELKQLETGTGTDAAHMHAGATHHEVA